MELEDTKETVSQTQQDWHTCEHAETMAACTGPTPVKTSADSRSRHKSQLLTQKLPAIGKCLQKKTYIFYNGVSLSIQSSLKGMTHVQKQMANRNLVQWCLWRVFVSQCFVQEFLNSTVLFLECFGFLFCYNGFSLCVNVYLSVCIYFWCFFWLFFSLYVLSYSGLCFFFYFTLFHFIIIIGPLFVF